MTRVTFGFSAASCRRERNGVPDGVAAVFEHPGFYPYLSGTRNLSLLARMDGRPAGDAARARAIERVGLTTAADRRVDGYSAGMRQRLGLAAALLRGPRLLLLDEPTSALDPAGARDVRELVRELAAAGAAIVISSHDLVEVEELCTSVTILRAGELVFSGSLEHLRARAGDDAHHLATSDDDTALAIARDCRGIRAARRATARTDSTPSANEMPSMRTSSRSVERGSRSASCSPASAPSSRCSCG